MSVKDPKTLVWYETLEIDELVAFQSNGLMKLKMATERINDPELREKYTKNIQKLELNISELIHFTIFYLYTQLDNNLK